MIRIMTPDDYDAVHACWMACTGMGLNTIDDSREGIIKVALVAFSRNDAGNAFWERLGFTARGDLTYRNKALCSITRIDT